MVNAEQLDGLDAQQLRELARALIDQIANREQQLASRDQQLSGQHQQITERDLQIASLDQAIASKDREIKYRQAKIEQLTHEMAVLKRWRFGRSREQLDSAQASLLDETIDADIAAIEQELEVLTPTPRADADTRKQPKRAALPPELPRIEMHHEPESTSCTTAGCGCTLKRIGEDVSEKLDYTPGLFTVERHIRANGPAPSARP